MSLRLYDYECQKCGNTVEMLIDSENTQMFQCAVCFTGVAKRIISASGVHMGNQDAKWVRESAAALLDMDTARRSKDPLERKLATNPDRETLTAYMKQKNLRYAENEKGAPPVYRKPEQKDTKAMADYLYKKHLDRKRIEVHS